MIARIDEGDDGRLLAASPAQAAAAATTNPAGAGETPALRGDSTAPVRGSDREDDQITTLSPAVRRAVLEYHVDPTKIRGTGKDGRLTKDDVIAAAQAQSSPAQAGAQAPQAKAPAPPEPRLRPLGSGLRRSASDTKSASRCRGFARPSPSVSRKPRTPPPC